ncbi:MAG TPA: hypothetical protein VLA76_11110 [Candidatus Angelobacter sp.]|nr:hypothetical protein [Candidatus Angelobacter sp.]
MTCRRICRELLSQARFGELGPGAAPHLEHLTDCRACRDELGFDRALVRQLRTALADRVAGMAPSSRVWEGIVERMGSPEPAPSRLRAWSTMLIARLRVGSAMAGATLAVLVTLNLEVVPVRPSDALHDGGSLPSTSAPPRPLDLADGFAQAGAATAELAPAGLTSDEPLIYASRGVWADEPEELPILGVRHVEAPDEQRAEEPAEPPAPRADPWRPLTVRLVPADAAVIGRAADSSAASDPAPDAEPPPSTLPEPEVMQPS